jgi:hypothetical protein
VKEYCVIGHAFTIRNRGSDELFVMTFNGPIVASSDAFFLFPDSTVVEEIASSPVGLVLALIVMGIRVVSGASNKQLDVCLYDFSELPREIVTHKDWPRVVRNRKDSKVIVIPKESIQYINYAFWDTMDLFCEDKIFKIDHNFVFWFSPIKFLNTRGWSEKLRLTKLEFSELLPILVVALGFGGGFFSAWHFGIFSAERQAPKDIQQYFIEFGTLMFFVIGGLILGLFLQHRAAKQREKQST